MLVNELIEILKSFPSDLEVCIVSDIDTSKFIPIIGFEANTNMVHSKFSGYCRRDHYEATNRPAKCLILTTDSIFSQVIDDIFSEED